MYLDNNFEFTNRRADNSQQKNKRKTLFINKPVAVAFNREQKFIF